MSAAARHARCLAAAAGDYRYMDNAEFDAASDWQGWSRWRAADEAARHLAAMSPERRAMLEAEWEERP